VQHSREVTLRLMFPIRMRLHDHILLHRAHTPKQALTFKSDCSHIEG
jgi:hypothetical protein